jgi:hypothetical protein
MKILLSNLCFSLSGSLGRGYGYHLEQRLNGCFAKRNSKGFVPPDGHWRFIVLCAELSVGGFPMEDIRLSLDELQDALGEAGIPLSDPSLSGARDVRRELNARDVLNLKTTFGL